MAAVLQEEAEAEIVVFLRLHRNSLAVLRMIGSAIEMLMLEGAVIGLRTAMTAQGVHRDSVAAVVGKQAEVEDEEAQQSAKMVATMQRFLVEAVADHCFAKTAAVMQRFLVEVVVDHCFAMTAAAMQRFLVEVVADHCFAMTAAALQYFQEEVGIGVDCCYTKN